MKQAPQRRTTKPFSLRRVVRFLLGRKPSSDAAWADEYGFVKRVGRIPTMVTTEEKQVLYWIAKDCYTGAGSIVELGPFLGGSTRALCAGLEDNPRPIRKDGVVHVYDRFTYDSYFQPWFKKYAGSYKVNDNFLDLWKELNHWLLPHLCLDPGDILESRYGGGPIEVLFVDICKSWEINNRTIAQFYGCLIPGSLVIHQDYLHFYEYWLVLTMEYFRDYFEEVGRVVEGSSTIYRLLKPIPPTMLTTDLRTMPLEWKRQAFERELDRTQGWQRTEILVGYIRMLMEAGAEAAAHDMTRRIPPEAFTHPINQVALTFIPPEYLAAAG